MTRCVRWIRPPRGGEGTEARARTRVRCTKRGWEHNAVKSLRTGALEAGGESEDSCNRQDRFTVFLERLALDSHFGGRFVTRFSSGLSRLCGSTVSEGRKAPQETRATAMPLSPCLPLPVTSGLFPNRPAEAAGLDVHRLPALLLLSLLLAPDCLEGGG
jgi:hypothetical protein